MDSRIEGLVRRYRHFGWLSDDDLRQHGLIGLFEATRDVDPEGKLPFEVFAFFCSKHQIIKASRWADARKFEHQNKGRSLDAPVGDLGMAVADVLACRLPSPHSLAETNELLRLVGGLSRALLSEVERRALALSLSGLKQEEIARETGKSPKSVETALRRARRKLDDGLRRLDWQRDKPSADGLPARVVSERLIAEKRAKVKGLLAKAPVPLSSAEIAEQLDSPVWGLPNLLKRMVREGEIHEPVGRRWSAFAPIDQSAWPAGWTVATKLTKAS